MMDVDFNRTTIENSGTVEDNSNGNLNITSFPEHYLSHKTSVSKSQVKTAKTSTDNQLERQAESLSTGNTVDMEADSDCEHVEYSVFYKLEDVENYIAEQEISQTTKFILNRICKGFGKPDPGKNLVELFL